MTSVGPTNRPTTPAFTRNPARWFFRAIPDRGTAVALALAAAWSLGIGRLALLRHRAFHSHAFDLGLHHHAVWNTFHGRFLEYTYFLAFHPELRCLLGDHVNLILVPIAALYAIHDGPETLLVAQAVILASAAFPAYRLSRLLLGSASAGLLVALLWLAHPSITAAALDDFHALPLAGAFFVWAFWLAEEGSTAGLTLALVLATSCQENVALVTALFGVWLFARRRRRAGAITFAGGMAWFAFCLLVLIPSFNGGVASNALARYGWLGGSPGAIVWRLLTEPHVILARLAEPATRDWLRGLFGPTAYLALLAPEVLLVAGSELGLNLLSAHPPQRTVEYHYAALSAAVIVVAATHGMARLARLVGRLGVPPRRAAEVAAVLALGLSLRERHLRNGDFRSLPPGGLAELQGEAHGLVAARVFSGIPAAAPLSAQSDIAPHVSQRPLVYLFPLVRDAETVLLDTTGSLFPVEHFLRPGRNREQSWNEYLQDLLTSGRFAVTRAEAGCLVLTRKAPSTPAESTAGVPVAPSGRVYHRGRILPDQLPTLLRAGIPATVGVTVHNESDAVWFPAREVPGLFQVNLAYHWRALDGAEVVADGVRTPLPGRVAPGGSVALRMTILPPPSPGRYRLVLDLVQEGVAWFASQGSPSVTGEVDVR